MTAEEVDRLLNQTILALEAQRPGARERGIQIAQLRAHLHQREKLWEAVWSPIPQPNSQGMTSRELGWADAIDHLRREVSSAL
jgi:hypothetical protein